MNNLEIDIQQILNYKTIAVVGLSPKPERPSCRVADYLKSVGYKIIPVNPGQQQILGEKCYPSLTAIPEKVEVVDIFRRSEEVLPVVQEAIRIGAKVVWMQEGIVNEAAAELARANGLKVVMDRCMRKEYLKWKKESKNA